LLKRRYIVGEEIPMVAALKDYVPIVTYDRRFERWVHRESERYVWVVPSMLRKPYAWEIFIGFHTSDPEVHATQEPDFIMPRNKFYSLYRKD
jgi:hypothetical protein